MFHRDLKDITQDSRSLESLLMNVRICESVKEVQLGNCRSWVLDKLPGAKAVEVRREMTQRLQRFPNLQMLRYTCLGALAQICVDVHRIHKVHSAENGLMIEILALLIAVRPDLEICGDDLTRDQFILAHSKWREDVLRSRLETFDDDGNLSLDQLMSRRLSQGLLVSEHVVGTRARNWIPDTGFDWCTKPLLDWLRNGLRSLHGLRLLHLDCQPEPEDSELSSQYLHSSKNRSQAIHLPSVEDFQINTPGDLRVLHCLDMPDLRRLKIWLTYAGPVDEESLKSFSIHSHKVKSLTIRQHRLTPDFVPQVIDCDILANWTLFELFLDNVLSASESPPPNFATDIAAYQIQPSSPLTKIQAALPPNLFSLRLHQATIASSEFSKPFTFTRGALTAIRLTSPSLAHLEMNIGDVDKLWNPTAVLGVDVDVGIYSLLKQIAAFPRLTFLRLIVPYFDLFGHALWSSGHPLTDDGQAVRIFQALRSLGSRVQRLLISPDPEMLDEWSPRETDPMAWEVRGLGDKVLLVVRQRGKDYEHRQVWSGQRRLRTSIKHIGWERSIVEICG